MFLPLIFVLSVLVLSDAQGTKGGGGQRYRPLPSIPKPSFFGTKSASGAESNPTFIEPPPAPSAEPGGDGPEITGPPMPYAFSYEADGHDGRSARQESSDGKKVTGSYMLEGADGINRMVYYVADENGFRATVMTNEPGTESQDSAGVIMRSSQPPAEELSRLYGPGEPVRDANQAKYIGAGAGNIPQLLEPSGFDDESAQQQQQLRDDEPLPAQERQPSWQPMPNNRGAASQGTKTLQRPETKRPLPSNKRPVVQRPQFRPVQPQLPPPPPPARKLPQSSNQIPSQRPLPQRPQTKLPQPSQRFPSQLPPPVRMMPLIPSAPRGKVGAASQNQRPFFRKLAPVTTEAPWIPQQKQEQLPFDEPQQRQELPNASQQQQVQLREEDHQQLKDDGEDEQQQQEQIKQNQYDEQQQQQSEQLPQQLEDQQQQQEQYRGFF